MKYKRFKFIKTGNVYEVVEVAALKHPETRNWVDCVVYRQYADYIPESKSYQLYLPGMGEVFVREKSDFLSKFEEIEL